ncbi:MAG: hypothetical protein JST40_09645 [Armatimonadetes bacterium]|nr:hypothetical protein [Armatimonadota bacterium]
MTHRFFELPLGPRPRPRMDRWPILPPQAATRLGLLLIFLLAVVAGAIARQTDEDFQTFRVLKLGQPVGKAYYKWLLSDNGSLRTILTLVLAEPQKPAIRVRTESTFKQDGAPILKTTEIEVNKKVTQRLLESYEPGKVTTKSVGVEGSEKSIAIEKSLPTDQKFQFWFHQKMPSMGEVNQFYFYDHNSNRWSLMEVKYSQKKSVTIGAKTFEAHVLSASQSGVSTETWMASDGTMLKMAMGDYVIERVFEEK